MSKKADLETRIKVLKEDKADLEREIRYMKREFELEKDNLEEQANIRIEQTRLEERKKFIGNSIDIEAAKIRIEELQDRIDDSPYKQLQEILKDLVVKLPTLDIKELSVKTKEK